MECSYLLELFLEEISNELWLYPFVIQVVYLLDNDLENTEVSENVFLYWFIDHLLCILESPSSLINRVFVCLLFRFSCLFYFLDFLEYIWYRHDVFDIFCDIHNMSITAVKIRLSGLNFTILEVLKAFVTDHKSEDDPAEELKQLSWRWPKLRALLLGKFDEEVLYIDVPILDRLLDRRV